LTKFLTSPITLRTLCQIHFYDYPKSSATETLNRPFNPSSLFVKQHGGQE
jgi:hypothetical protein